MTSTRSYSVVEPHPTAQVIHGGRGGAGNVTRVPNKGNKVPSAIITNPPSSSSNRLFASGRGGAGNVHHSSERAIFSFDEELERQLRQQKDLAPVYHVGRGGAGNMVYIDGSVRSSRRDSESGSDHSRSSTGTDNHVADSVKRGIGKGWKKVIGVGNYMTG